MKFKVIQGEGKPRGLKQRAGGYFEDGSLFGVGPVTTWSEAEWHPRPLTREAVYRVFWLGTGGLRSHVINGGKKWNGEDRE